jgi:hypothetical protein
MPHCKTSENQAANIFACKDNEGIPSLICDGLLARRLNDSLLALNPPCFAKFRLVS